MNPDEINEIISLRPQTAEIYIPINSTSLRSVIPPGEEILYSTLCLAWYKSGNRNIKGDSHVLLTQKGVAFTAGRYIRRKKPPKLNYTDWFYVIRLSKKGIILRHNFTKIRLILKREPNFESKERFKERASSFSNKFSPIFQARKNYVSNSYPDKKIRAEILRLRIV